MKTRSPHLILHLLLCLSLTLLGCAGAVQPPDGDATATLAGEVSIFQGAIPANASDADGQAVELGVKFQSGASGRVEGLSFYKSAANGGPHTGHLWDSSGKLLASVTFNNETQSGWQRARFSNPVQIQSGLVYVASYHTTVGHYAGDTGYFAASKAHGPLTALRDGASGGNGVYHYGGTAFPTSSYQASNYYVDVLFLANASDGGPPVPPTDAGTPPPPPPTDAGTSGGSPVPCPLTAAAGPCWASHTGVPGYSEAQILAGQSNLVHHVGDMNVTTDGTVIDRTWIDGCIAIHANNVTIKNSLIHTSNGCAGGNGGSTPSAINNGNGTSPAGLMIVDTEVDGMNGSGDTAGISDTYYTCLRCNVHGFNKNFWAGSHVLIQDTYSHDLNSNNPNCVHSENINADSGDHVTIEHSYIVASGNDCVTGAVMVLSSWGPPSDIRVNNSYLEGIGGADIASTCVGTNLSYTNNALSSNNGYGGVEYIVGWNPAGAGNASSGNYVPETGAPFTPVNGC